MILLQEPPRKTITQGLALAVRRREDEAHAFREDDARLATTVRRRLIELGHPQLRHLNVDVTNGRVALSGQLNRYYLLQVAQNAALSTPGVTGLESEVQVVRSSELELMED